MQAELVVGGWPAVNNLALGQAVLIWARAEFGGQFLGGGLAAKLPEESALYHG